MSEQSNRPTRASYSSVQQSLLVCRLASKILMLEIMARKLVSSLTRCTLSPSYCWPWDSSDLSSPSIWHHVTILSSKSGLLSSNLALFCSVVRTKNIEAVHTFVESSLYSSTRSIWTLEPLIHANCIHELRSLLDHIPLQLLVIWGCQHVLHSFRGFSTSPLYFVSKSTWWKKPSVCVFNFQGAMGLKKGLGQKCQLEFF
jgi:hypothetical protein